jgi:catechol 2,3-dioxygenase-like lactoylglutathione lyase family enzyme
MNSVSIGHIALFVPDLPAAEHFYQRIFAMQLLMRETELDDGLWYTLPMDKGWSDAQAAGIEIQMIALKRDAFVLALFKAALFKAGPKQGGPAPRTTVLEIGITMTAESIATVRHRLPESAEIVSHEYGDLMFRDPFDYLWHLWPTGQVFQSNGESSGRWLEL